MYGSRDSVATCTRSFTGRHWAPRSVASACFSISSSRSTRIRALGIEAPGPTSKQHTRMRTRGDRMDESTTDAGTIQALLDRLNHFRLPRALGLKKKVDEGGTLD